MYELSTPKRRCKICQEEKDLTKENFQERWFKDETVVYYSRKCIDCIKNGLQHYYNHRDYCKEVSTPEYKYKCIHEPELTGFLGKYLGFDQMRQTLMDGYMPPGSMWYREVEDVTYVIRGNEGLNHDSPPEEFERQRLEEL